MTVDLGDSHNFGRKVLALENGFIHKPRSLLFERIFLSSYSPFRKEIDTKIIHFFKDEISSSIFPDLKFSELSPPFYSGEVAKLSLDFNDKLSTEMLVKAGILIAICTYFGIGDLHDHNIAVGYLEKTKEFICSPLDIECIFGFCRLPSQTLLIPSKFATYENCGLKKIFNLLSVESSKRHQQIIYILFGYLKTINLIHNSAIINALFASIPDDAPIRVIVRDTQVYYDFLRKGQKKPFLQSEIVQLERGDIPFFYRKVHSPEIKWLSRSSNNIWDDSSDLENMEMHEDSKKILEPFLLRGVHPCYEDLIHASSLQIVRNLFPLCDKNMKSFYKGFCLETDSTNVTIINDEGFKWSCKY